MFILMLTLLKTTQRTSVPWSSWWLHSISFSSKEIGFRFRIASAACVSCKVYAVPPPADWYPPPEPEMIVCQETTWRFWAAVYEILKWLSLRRRENVTHNITISGKVHYSREMIPEFYIMIYHAWSTNTIGHRMLCIEYMLFTSHNQF